MTSMSQDEIDERAFGLFLREGIQYFLQQDPPLQRGNVIQYSHRLYQIWIQMSQDEKSSYLRKAHQDVETLRERSIAVFRSAMYQVVSTE